MKGDFIGQSKTRVVSVGGHPEITPAHFSHPSTSQIIGSINNFTSGVQSMQCNIHTKLRQIKTKSPFPVFPHMILVGAQKAGTSAINEVLQRIPDFMEPRIMEPHFWDYHALPVLKRDNLTESTLCTLASQYASYWPNLMTNSTASTIVYEKTPNLLAIPDMAWIIRTFLDIIHPNHPVKLLVILRDPVQRFYSQYKMDFQRQRIVTQLDDFIASEVTKLVYSGVLQAPIYNKSVGQWHSSMFGLGGAAAEHYKGFIARGLYSKQLKWYMKYFTLGKSLKVVRYEHFRQKPVETLESIVQFVRGQGNPAVSLEAKLALGMDLGPVFTKYKDVESSLSNHAEQYLRLLYKPFNDELAEMLGESWRDVWV